MHPVVVNNDISMNQQGCVSFFFSYASRAARNFPVFAMA